MGFSRQEYWSGVPLPSLDFILCYQLKYLGVGEKKQQALDVLGSYRERPVMLHLCGQTWESVMRQRHNPFAEDCFLYK